MNNEKYVKKVIPMIMLVFISSATMISVYSIISPQLTIDFDIPPTTVSLLSMIALLMMGVASVAYSTLSDFISIRKLMIFGVSLLNIGTVLALIASTFNFYVLLVAVALMMLGGTCGSGLMIITVTRYINGNEHAKYYGFNTACVSISQAMGILLGGIVTTYLKWNFLFIIPLLSLIALPSILKYLPDDKKVKQGNLDCIGLTLLTLFTLMISIYLNFNEMIYLVISLTFLGLFLMYITKYEKAFISIDFFKNINFVVVIFLVALAFGIQSAFAFLFSFSMQGIYQISLDKVSLIILPSYMIGACIGMNSGKIINRFGSYKTLCIAVCIAISALVLGACTLDKSILFMGICCSMFAGAFALLYAPFMQLIIGTLHPAQIGSGIGFFNLMTSIGPSILIVLTGKLLSMQSMQKSLGIVNASATVYSNILFIFAGILGLVLIILYVKRNTFKIEREE